MTHATWAKQIKELDDNKCAFCGAEVQLEAHHIKQRAEHPEAATAFENGITLCHGCHHAAHNGDYTTKHRRLYTAVGFSCDPEQIKAFIAEYAASKVVLTVPKGKKDEIKAYAESKGESVNSFINRAIDEAMERDK